MGALSERYFSMSVYVRNTFASSMRLRQVCVCIRNETGMRQVCVCVRNALALEKTSGIRKSKKCVSYVLGIRLVFSLFN